MSLKDSFAIVRERMVDIQVYSRGIADPKVLAAMRKVPRHEFVPAAQLPSAYNDGPLPIGKGQTISQPYIVAYMTELLELKGEEIILELGTGCGYQTAVLAEIVKHVYTVEIIKSLSIEAEMLLRKLNYTNISFKIGNGKEGWKEYAPFDRIIITAAPTQFPRNLFDQLMEGGIAVAPVGDFFQRMMRYRKEKGKIKEEALIGVSFVPFV
ncbi:MAG: protein-L-isoaspartate(D-aspartate) O-methyltransferase [Acidobacteria bacterium]|jgi:protein-L-isoaspartate(D-aspartate) O-methyltransferase|nr:protein-L-isoaspartate(D-aspartate) O-methyltransferase [Acidobacteriota bacterium]